MCVRASVGTTTSSDFECAAFLPSFFPACSNIISIMLGDTKLADFHQLHKT